MPHIEGNRLTWAQTSFQQVAAEEDVYCMSHLRSSSCICDITTNAVLGAYDPSEHAVRLECRITSLVMTVTIVTEILEDPSIPSR
jgi:hypothetical protein